MSSLIVEPASEGNAPEPQVTAPVQAPEDDLPEKYRGKSIKDIVEMHRHAESELGRKNNEIGSIRKLADELIGIRRIEAEAANTANKPKPITADQLIDNPEETILQVARREATERTKELADRLGATEAELALARFEKKHPDYQRVMVDPDFGKWVESSPYRQQLALKAGQNGDLLAGDELFSLYAEQRLSRQDSPEAEKPDTGIAAAKKAGLARSGGSTAGKVVPSAGDKPIFKRSDLMEMRIKNPDEFDRLQPQILEAYREKRVK